MHLEYIDEEDKSLLNRLLKPEIKKPNFEMI
jgi:hypothetical protein